MIMTLIMALLVAIEIYIAHLICHDIMSWRERRKANQQAREDRRFVIGAALRHGATAAAAAEPAMV